MASAFQVQAPEFFNFSTPNEWPRWKKKFERFRTVSELTKKDEATQIEMLMYLMGDKADDVFRCLKFSKDEDKKKIDKILEAFDNHFICRRNVIYERALFNSRNQEEGESVEDFITALYKLAEHCNYQGLHEEMIRDRIVVGVKDKSLSERLQLDNALTLEKAVAAVRQHDAIKKQQQDLQCQPTSLKVDQVKSQMTSQKKTKWKKSKKGKSDEPRASGSQCGQCGYAHWKGKPCPAKDAECRKCKGVGHYASRCRSKVDADKGSAGVKKVTKDQNSENIDAFMLEITSSQNSQDDSERRKRWTAVVKVNQEDVNFKLDSGAKVTVLPYYEFLKKHKRMKLKKPDKNLRAADGNYLDCVGMFEAKLMHKTKIVDENIYVVRKMTEPLLSLGACELLELVKRLNVIGTDKCVVNPSEEFPNLFNGIGCVGTPYEIKLREGAIPFAVHTPKRVPIPLMKKLKARLDELLKMDIIKPVEEATEWCAPTAIAGKPNGDIRLCIDLTRLNQSLDREIHPMPVVEHTLGQLGGAKYFSKLDANSGFHQIKLEESSQLLTTFITPFGRFCFQRLPFGISTAPEYFQRTMSIILQGIDGVICYLDDILIFAETIEEHDNILRKVLNKLKAANVTLNKEKCSFGVTEVNFLGHVVNADGIRPDPKKIEAVKEMPTPNDVHDVRRFLGLVNHLGRFVQNLSEEAAPLNQLLCQDQEFLWGPSQKKAFERLKDILTRHPTLATYDVNRRTMVSADASSYGIGAVLKQETTPGTWRPIAYASRTMTAAERRYAQIEKEALALTWACERYKDFLTGKHFMIETDHKPLVPIFSTKDLDTLTPRLQRFRMRMMRFSFDIHHTPGKDLIAADALSRQPLPTEEDAEDEEMVAAYIDAVLSCIPVTDTRLSEIWKAQQEDRTLMKIMEYCQNGWPAKKELGADCQPFWSVRDELASQNGLLMRGCRIVIPMSMRKEILEKIHTGHLGINKCRLRARETVWWPLISTHIEEMIKKCTVCIQESTNRHEPLMASEFPTRPWQRIGMDLLNYEKKWYLVVIDYYSRFPEIVQLERLTAEVIVRSCKSIFARHGVPEIVISDNGTQFGDPMRNVHPGASREFAKFAAEYGFIHRTSSPKFPQSNGMAEAAVKIMKNILKKNIDASKALMEYRATPLENGYSPAELLMGRKLRTTVPAIPEVLQPRTVTRDELAEREEKRKNNMKTNYDRRHGARDLDELQVSDVVWVIDLRTWGRVREKAETPRSYFIKTPRGIVRRNRYHLKKGYDIPLPDATPERRDDFTEDEDRQVPDEIPPAGNTPPRNGLTVTKYGRVVKKVRRYGIDDT